jgi:lipid-binding SYLF domain-containing protein
VICITVLRRDEAWNGCAANARKHPFGYFSWVVPGNPFFASKEVISAYERQEVESNLEKSRISMKLLICGAALAASLLSVLPVSAQSMSSLKDRLNASAQVVREIEQTPDGGIPDAIVSKATCIAVIPSVKKGAFIVGASYGQGVVTCRTKRGWSGPVFIRLAGGSFGFQIGGQATDLILVAVNQKGFQDLLRSKFKIGADASAAAGPVGRHAAASTDILLNAELLSYSRAKGVFAGIDLNGADVSQNTDDTNLFYGGHAESFEQILSGKVPTPEAAHSFVATVGRYFRSTR